MIARVLFPVLGLFASGIVQVSLRAHGFMVGGLPSADARTLKRSPGLGRCGVTHKELLSVASGLAESMGEKEEPIQHQRGVRTCLRWS